MLLRSLSAFSTVSLADFASARMCMRSVWKCEKAVSTVFTASAMAWACALHAPAEVDPSAGAANEDADALGDAVGDAVAVTVGDALCEADALADAEADGL